MLAISAILALPSAHAAQNAESALKNAAEKTQAGIETAAGKVGNALESGADKAGTTLNDVAKRVNKFGTKVFHAGEAKAQYAGRRIEQDTRNFFRWVREKTCAGVGRKDGAAAKQQCDADVAANKAARVTPHGEQYRYHAAMEVDCLGPGEHDKAATVTIRNWSSVSKSEAQAAVQSKVKAANVCSREWNDRSLRDGASRWVSE